MRPILLLIFVWLCIGAWAGNTDSLLQRLKTPLHDTDRVKTLSQLARQLENKDPEGSRNYYRQCISLALKGKYTQLLGRAYNSYGSYFLRHDQYDSALRFFSTALPLLIETNDTLGIIYVEKNAGTIHFFSANYNKALESYFNCLKYAEKLDNVKELGASLGNIGNVYKEQGKYKEALDFFNRSKKYMLQLSGAKLATNYINTGNVYYEMGKQKKSMALYDSALSFYTLAESILLSGEDSSILGMLYNNIGNIFTDKNQYQQALMLYKKALLIRERISDFEQIGVLYENISSCYIEMNEDHLAEESIKKGLQYAENSRSYNEMSQLYRDYATVFERKKDFRNAYKYHILFKQYADSILNGDNIEKRKELEMNFAFEKEREQKKLEETAKEVLRQEEKKRSAIYMGITFAGLVIAILIALIIFRNLRLMKRANSIISKQKSEIERQKDLVMEKQKEILDSIHYARRIQRSLMPSEKYIKRNLEKLRK